MIALYVTDDSSPCYDDTPKHYYTVLLHTLCLNWTRVNSMSSNLIPGYSLPPLPDVPEPEEYPGTYPYFFETLLTEEIPRKHEKLPSN